MPGDVEPSVPSGEGVRASDAHARDESPRDDAGPRTDRTPPPTVDLGPPSSVRPSAPTVLSGGKHGDSDPSLLRRSPVVIRTPIPPSPLDLVVPSLSHETTTGQTPKPISTTMRSGASRTMVGTTLGRYEILEELGHGGMATVYRARDPRLERDVALKVIHRHLRDNPEIAHRFRHEAKAVAKLKHPSIVEIYDVPDVDDEERFLVAEFVDGPSLRRYLQGLRAELGHEHPGLFPPEVAASLVLQILGALGRAHELGIVHRDVKPENILVSGLGGPTSQRPSDPSRTPPVAKLTDFGIAKILDAQSMTSTGQILGSPAHMAPEQIEAGDISPKVDIFATGVLFYELMTGNLPFDGKNPAQVIRRVLDGEFTPADRVVPQIGGRWSSIVATMLARDPERRPGDVAEVEAPIRRELEAMGITDSNAELVAFIIDPKVVAEEYGARLKPRLVARGLACRDAGDVVGAANDLNRAVAYDPADVKLVRAVGSMRSRERRLRNVRRAVPVLLLALLISAGTFVVVRLVRTPETIGPVPSATTGTSVTEATSTSGPASDSASASGSASGSAQPPSTAPTSTVVAAPPAVDAGTKVRTVSINVLPPADFTIDGKGTYQSPPAPKIELPVGSKHTLLAKALEGWCCDALTANFTVEPGDGEQTLQYRLAIRPAVVNVFPDDKAQVRVLRDGKVLAHGPSGLSVPIDAMAVEVTIEVTPSNTDFQAKTETVSLTPGAPHTVKLAK